ncbi:hypothetical protein LCGC14_0476420 [marine sediment metagenome]|uniref:Uncharacterized protein n=1 Tax=marine sediment metagenome TaxID=412755 RepID=A0A0F9SFX2_9ZZZZ
MSEEIYLNLDRKTIEATKEEAKKRDIEQCGEEDSTSYLYPNVSYDIDDIELDDETIKVNGNMIDSISGKELGYISIDFTPDLDLIIELIQTYMKKLGKLKTILEATK